MSTGLRIFMMIAGVFTAFWLTRRIRKNKIRLADSVFWIGLAVLMLIVGVVPEVIYWLSRILEIQSPINCLLLMLIALLIEKLFTASIQISQMQNKIEELVAEVALRTKDED